MADEIRARYLKFYHALLVDHSDLRVWDAHGVGKLNYNYLRTLLSGQEVDHQDLEAALDKQLTMLRNGLRLHHARHHIADARSRLPHFWWVPFTQRFARWRKFRHLLNAYYLWTSNQDEASWRELDRVMTLHPNTGSRAGLIAASIDRQTRVRWVQVMFLIVSICIAAVGLVITIYTTLLPLLARQEKDEAPPSPAETVRPVSPSLPVVTSDGAPTP